MSKLEAQFHDAMIELYHIAKRDCKYNATYFLGMVIDHGGLQTAKKLLATENPSEGLGTLALCGRLDLTVEAHVIKPEFRGLFSSQEIEIATQRLKDYGHKF